MPTFVRVYLLASALPCLACSAEPTAPAQVLPTTTRHVPGDRQSLRDQSVFQNLDFEDVDGAGTPKGWQCLCAGGVTPCTTTTMTAAHGQRSLVLSSGCYAYQTTTAFDATKGVDFNYFSSGATSRPTDVGISGSDAMMTHTLYTDGAATSADWTLVASRGAMPTDNQTYLLLSVYNSEGTLSSAGAPRPDLLVDDIVADQSEPNPPPKVGALLRATHIEQFTVTSPGGAVYFSLPSSAMSQVPLYFELTATPQSAVESVSYTTETEGNWDATVHFAEAAQGDVLLRWDAVALVRIVPDADLPVVYAASLDPSNWLAPSGVAENDPNISAVATALVTSGSSALDAMAAVIGWTSKNIKYDISVPAADATTVFNARGGVCTGFANLAMSMGRTLGVPTRHITNMMVGTAQAMHSIDEFYLGPAMGWRRVEPQRALPRIWDDYGFVMRVVHPEDETPPAYTRGVPLHELTEIVAPGVVYSQSASPTFSDCDVCPDSADPQADLRDATTTALAQTFAQAVSAWQADLATFASEGAIPASRLAIRRQFETARTLADVASLVGQL